MSDEPEIEMTCWACGAKCPQLDYGVVWRCGECGSHTVRVKRVDQDERRKGVVAMSECQPMPGDSWGQTMVDAGYTWCRPCADYHRPPECAIREDGSVAHWWVLPT